jgi:xanthine dehydrogenase accessory factor
MTAVRAPAPAGADPVRALARLAAHVRAGGRAVWVRVERVEGSAPREPGAAMRVDADGTIDGTIGGGHLEHDAIGLARRLLASGERVARCRRVLGASLGQCCGGVVELSLRVADARELGWIDALAALEREGGTLWLETRADAGGGPHTVASGLEPVAGAEARATPDATDPAARPAGTAAPGRDATELGGRWRIVSRVEADPWTVWVFGAGHVGDALVRVLGTLPARVVMVDPRLEVAPAGWPPGAAVLASDSPAHEVAAIPAGADVLVMTHSHALDFDLCRALLARDDLGLVGLIGSYTKAASFRGRLARRGLSAERIARLRCPVGAMPADGRRAELDRHPGAIAVSVAFELWQHRRARTLRPAGAVGEVGR